MVELKHTLILKVKSQGAEPGPPLGTVLGNLGVNTSKFCKDFNDFTKDLPVYFVLLVTVYVYENRSFKFEVKAPSTGYLLSIMKFEKTLYVKVGASIVKRDFYCVFLDDLVRLALFKFSDSN